MNRKTNEITLSKEQREESKAALSAYMLENFSLELGNLGAELLLNHISEHIGLYYYNIAIEDAQRYMQEKVEDIDFLLRDNKRR